MLMALPRGSSLAKTREWVARMTSDPHTIFLVITGPSSSRVKGYIQLAHIDPLHGHGELGICLSPEARGQGYGADALKLLESHARRVFNLGKAVLRVLANHQPAVALYRKCGYTDVGVLREHFYQDGKRHDVRIMEKILTSTRAAS